MTVEIEKHKSFPPTVNVFSAPTRVIAVLVTLIISAFASAHRAATPAPSSPAIRITQSVDNSLRMVIPGSTNARIRSAQDLGPVDSNLPMRRMLLVLKQSDAQQKALRALLDSQQDKRSPNYHKWLTPEKFSAQFGAASQDLVRVTEWLRGQGFSEVKVARGAGWIEFSGTAAQVESAFQTSIHNYQYNGAQHVANATDISLPQALTPVVSGVLSLHNFEKRPTHTPPSMMKRNESGHMQKAGLDQRGMNRGVNPDFTFTDPNSGTTSYLVAPGDFHKIYNVQPLLQSGIDGTGVSIAIVGRADIFLTDVQVFRFLFGLPENDPNFIVSGPDPGFGSPGDGFESALDVEWAGAVAPKATISLVEAASTETTDGVDLSAAYIVDNVVAPILSESYGACEMLLGTAENQFINALWEQAAAEGITVLISSGDSGAAECDGDLQHAGIEPPGPAQYGYTVNGLASTPYDLAVGGTQFDESITQVGNYWSANNGTDFSSAFGYIPEQVWNESCDPTLPAMGTNCVYGQQNYNFEGGGGGPSSCSVSTANPDGTVTCVSGYSKPAWQTGTGVPNDHARDIPDVALNASPNDEGYVVCYISACEYIVQNGQVTITQTDVVGGTSVSTPAMAGVMALVEQQNGAFQGQANYTLYKLAAQEDLNACNSSNLTNPEQPNSCMFYDITLGNNSDPGLPGYGTPQAQWAAGTGYDLATGLGSVNAANLVANWAQATFQPSSTALTANSSSFKHGTPLTVNVAVTDANGNGTPSGDFSLSTDKYGAVGEFSLTNGSYSGSVSNLPGGSYNLSAHYAGDATFSGSSSNPVPFTVTPEGSTISFFLEVLDQSGNLVPLVGPLTYSQNLYVNTTVTGASGQGTPTGTVNVMDGSAVIATFPLNASGAQIYPGGGPFATANFTLPGGTHTLSVAYSGDNSFSPSSAPPVTVNVNRYQTYTQASANIPPGQVGPLTALVFSSGLIEPSGTVQFYDNGTPIGAPATITMNGLAGTGYPQATANVGPLSAGQHYIAAQYSGDPNYLPVDPSSQYATGVTVTMPKTGKATTTVSLICSPSVITYGQSVNLLVKVTPVNPGAPTPTGTIQIFGTGFFSGSGTLQNGVVTIPIPPTDAGLYEFYAQYSGDSNSVPNSYSGIVTLTENPVATPVSLTTPSNYVLTGSETSLNFTATGVILSPTSANAPNGNVLFLDAVNGGPAQPLAGPFELMGGPVAPTSVYSLRANLPTGINVITAYFEGAQDFAPATTAPVTISVQSPDFAVSATPPTLDIPAGSTGTSTFTASSILGFAGTVTLACGTGIPAGATCTITPATLTLNGSPQTANLSVSVLSPSSTAASAMPVAQRTSLWAVSGVGALAGIFLLGAGRGRRRKSAALLTILCVIGYSLGCGSGSGGAPVSKTLVQLTSTASKVASGAPVDLTATVLASGSSPTGTVSFFDGATQLGQPVPLSNGTASLQTTSLNVGTHILVAKYSGDQNDEAATSNRFNQVITGSTALQVTGSAGAIVRSVNLTVVVE